MKKLIKIFLEFEQRTISHIDLHGQFWIAIKPICAVLNVDYKTQFKNVKADPILRKAVGVQKVTAADYKQREMSCLPEFFIYVWILQIQSNSNELMEYKLECARLLYKNFKGAIKTI